MIIAGAAGHMTGADLTRGREVGQDLHLVGHAVGQMTGSGTARLSLETERTVMQGTNPGTCWKCVLWFCFLRKSECVVKLWLNSLRAGGRNTDL